MGVNGLLHWIRKSYPTALKSFPKRWASPEIKGKRIAIDATLLTTRYHFAITEGPLRGKGALVGWYNLLSLMRAHDVQPVAIWDQPGVRAWKAAEARRRLNTRLVASARRQHEDERQERLTDLREGLSALQALSEEEQEVIRLGWSRGRYTDDPASTVPSTATPPPPKPSHTPSLDTHAPEEVEDTAEEAIEGISSMEDTLRTLVGRYRSSLPSPTNRDARGGIDDVVEHIVELEKLSESLDAVAERATLDHAERRSTRQAARDYVDDRLGELLPPGEFSETRRQNELTLEEGRIIEEFMRPKSVEAEAAGEETQAGSSSAEVEAPVKPETPPIPADVSSLPILAGYLDAAEPLDRLDALIEAAPPVRDIYDRALFVPTAETHADCRDLLARLGVPILMAEPPYEAEGLATSLALAGVVDWVGSEDSDVIPLGGPLLKNLSLARQPLIALPPSDLLSLISLTRAQLIDFCILLGNDACPRIPGVGAVAGYKQIVKHGSIEAILEHEKKVRDKVPDMQEYMELVRGARTVFGDLPPISEEVKGELETTFAGMKGQELDLEGVERWMEERHGIRFVNPDEGYVSDAAA